MGTSAKECSQETLRQAQLLLPPLHPLLQHQVPTLHALCRLLCVCVQLYMCACVYMCTYIWHARSPWPSGYASRLCCRRPGFKHSQGWCLNCVLFFSCDIDTCIQFPHKRIPSCKIGTQLWLRKGKPPTVSKVIAVVQVGLRIPTLQLVGTVLVNAWPGYRRLSVQT